MPQASDALRDLMRLMFGDEISETGPMDYLQSRGWKLTRQWEWQLPRKDYWVDEKEELCLRFLVDEWDFGWIEKEKPDALR